MGLGMGFKLACSLTVAARLAAAICRVKHATCFGLGPGLFGPWVATVPWGGWGGGLGAWWWPVTDVPDNGSVIVSGGCGREKQGAGRAELLALRKK